MSDRTKMVLTIAFGILAAGAIAAILGKVVGG